MSENDLYSSISGVVVFVSRWMFFVSFLRHSPSHFPEGNLVYIINDSGDMNVPVSLMQDIVGSGCDVHPGNEWRAV